MHGRFAALSALLLTMTFGAGTARADQTLAPGQPAAADGVVTSWRITVPPAQLSTVALRSLQTTGGGTVTTGTTDPRPIPLVPDTYTFPARLSIAAGGTLDLVGETGSPSVSAVVEPDADGDGYGDTTQDTCPADFTTHTGPCPGTATIGSPLTLAPDPRGFSGSPMQALQQAAPGTTPAVTAAGILTRWRLRADPTAGDTVLQLLRPSGPGFRVVAESTPVHVTSGAVVSIPAQMAVLPGDRLAARSQTALGAVAYRAGDVLGTHQPPATSGATWSPEATYADRRLLVQADVEPDRDADGKGDVSQDSADLAVVAVPQARHPYPYRLTNKGPDAALDVVVRLEGNTKVAPPGWTCTYADQPSEHLGVTSTCTIARLDAGTSIDLAPGAWVTGGPSDPYFGTTASVTASTPDPDSTNNTADGGGRNGLQYTPGSYTPPPVTFDAPACAVVGRGTRDDDVLRGTLFGDRLVGGDGSDLLKGGPGDDCLEGGAGNDVLDGGDGNDRLAGSSGKDRLMGGTGNDRLTGGKGNDRLVGGPGADVLSPGDGHDVVDAGGGNDTINSVDGVRETIDCGAGRDTVRADRRDRLKHCEKVTRRR